MFVVAGFLGGNFFKRAPLLKSDGSRLDLRDFSIGNSILALGVEIFVTDADPFTREYYR